MWRRQDNENKVRGAKRGKQAKEDKAGRQGDWGWQEKGKDEWDDWLERKRGEGEKKESRRDKQDGKAEGEQEILIEAVGWEQEEMEKT